MAGRPRGLLLALAAVLAAASCQAAALGPASAPAGGGGGACACAADGGLADSLLAQLQAAQHANAGLRDQLLRSKHHRPLVLTNPFGPAGNSLWQAAAALLALLAAASAAQAASSRGKAAARYSDLQRVLQLKEALWRRGLATASARQQRLLQQYQAKEAAWHTGLAELTRRLEQRAGQGRAAAAKAATPAGAAQQVRWSTRTPWAPQGCC